MRHSAAVALLAMSVLLSLASPSAVRADDWSMGGDSAAKFPTKTPIKHVVVIFDENISFDHYFGTYPNALNLEGETSTFHPAPDTPLVNGLTPTLLTNNPNNYSGGSNPFRLNPSQAATCNPTNAYTKEQQAFDSGLLDKFIATTTTTSCGYFLPTPPQVLTMGYYDGNTVTAAQGQSRDAGYVTVQAAAVTPHLETYGQIELGATLTLSFAEAGVISELQAVPGAQVRAGQELAHLDGPEIRSMLLQAKADVRRAQAKLSASRNSFAIQQQQLTLHQSTQQAVREAESAVAQARTSFADARSHVESVRQMMTLSAPVDATVLMVNAAPAQLVGAAQPILTLQTPYRLSPTNPAPLRSSSRRRSSARLKVNCWGCHTW